MSLLTVDHLSVRYGRLTVLDDVHFSLNSGEWLMLVGPNGAGKSTVLGAVSQSIAYEGTVRICGDDAKKLSQQTLARRVGVLMQNHTPAYGFTVGEVVSLGRYAYRKGAFSRGEEDGAAVKRALDQVGMEKFYDHSVLTLSGGELQRTFLAQLIAQDPQILLLDEPTNHLDLAYQKQTFELVGEWIKRPGRAAVSVVHDLSLARRYGTHALLLEGGHQTGPGETEAVLTRDKLQSVYDIDVYDWMRNLLAQWE